MVLQEIKYVCPSFNIANALIKTTKMKDVLQILLQKGRYDLPEGFLDLGTKEQNQHLAHHFTSGRYDLPGGHFELGMTERRQQPLRKPHVTIKKENPSNEKKALKDAIRFQNKPKPTHRGVLKISKENNETGEENHGEETSERDYKINEENHRKEENGKEDPTFEEYHSIKEKRKDNNSETNFTNDSTRVNPLPDWPIHVVGNQPLDCSRYQLKPVKEEMYI